MSSNLSLSSLSHRPLNSAGAQQDSPADTSPKTPEFLEDAFDWSPSTRELHGVEQMSPGFLMEEVSFDEDIPLGSRFENFCLEFSMQESDLGPFREKLLRFDSAVALYNDFIPQLDCVKNIKEVFQGVFKELEPGKGFEGEFRAFFMERIGILKESKLINNQEAFDLTKLAKPQDLGSSSSFGQR